MRVVNFFLCMAFLFGGCSKRADKELAGANFGNEIAEFKRAFSSKKNHSKKTIELIELINREQNECKRQAMVRVLADSILTYDFSTLDCDLRVVRASDFYFSVLAAGECMKAINLPMCSILDFYISGWMKYKKLCFFESRFETAEEQRCRKECRTYYKSAVKRFSYLVVEVFCKQSSEREKRYFLEKWEKLK